MSFPFDLGIREVVAADLELFAPEFADVVGLFFPGSDVRFAGLQSAGEEPSVWKAGLEMVRSEQKPVVDSGEHELLFLPLWSNESLLGIAVIAGNKGGFDNATSAGLLEKSRVISAQMAQVKHNLLDAVTGLPGIRFLERRVQELRFVSFSLSLLEIHPRARDAAHALSLIAGSAAFLESLIGHLCSLCHLGNGVFACIMEKTGEEQAIKLAEMLLRWLKREGFARSRIGIAVHEATETEAAVEQVFDQAWEALVIARKRGPYALCSYQAVTSRAAHPLCAPSGRVFFGLKKLWQDEERFGLVLLHLDHLKEGVSVPWADYVDRSMVKIDDQEAFVFLAEHDLAGVEKWCRELLARAKDDGISFSIGAAVYPHEDFKKSELVANCRKALIHTGFFGPGTLTFFSGVSLNISGDIYYNEGDLARAVREYRLGLRLDPQNINLLNSLGVALAQMNLYKKAIPLFQDVLSFEPANFMALFNLGFACLALRQEAEAMENFERALAVDDTNFDLLLQLGKLYCKVGRFGEAVQVLTKGEQVGPVGVRDISHGAVYRYLGEARRGLGENVQAMASLQRAVRHNPRDAAALSMLGELYCLENQGGDIALSLCRQAVALDEGEWRHWSRLCFVLLAMERYDEALRAIKKGLAISGRNPELLCRLGFLYAKRGRSALAMKTYRKVVRLDPLYREAAERLAQLEKESGSPSD